MGCSSWGEGSAAPANHLRSEVGEGPRQGRLAEGLPLLRPPLHGPHPLHPVQRHIEGHDGPRRPALGDGRDDLPALHDARQQEVAGGIDTKMRAGSASNR